MFSEMRYSTISYKCNLPFIDLTHTSALQAHIQVLRFGAQKIFLGRQDFCFYCMFKSNFSGDTNLWGCTKRLGGITPECPPWLRACCSNVKAQIFLPTHGCFRRWTRVTYYSVWFRLRTVLVDCDGLNDNWCILNCSALWSSHRLRHF